MVEELIIRTTEDCREAGLKPKLLRREAQNHARFIAEKLGMTVIEVMLATGEVGSKVQTRIWKNHPDRPYMTLSIDLPPRLERWAFEEVADKAQTERQNG